MVPLLVLWIGYDERTATGTSLAAIIVISAVGTLSLGAIGAYIGPLIILAVAAIGWSVVMVLVFGRRIFPRHWFEHSIAEFGDSQGMLSCGFLMVDMVDPKRETDVIRSYSYRQIITRPILGGGFMTALAVPLIDRFGLPAFTIATAAVGVALTAWGMKQGSRQTKWVRTQLTDSATMVKTATDGLRNNG